MAVEFSFKGDTCVAMLTGVLDGTSGPLLVEQVKSQVSPGGKLVVDFSQATGLDVNGLRSMLSIKRRLDKEHGQLSLSGMSREIEAVIASNGCEGMFPVSAAGAGGASEAAPPPPPPAHAEPPPPAWTPPAPPLPPLPPVEPVPYTPPVPPAPTAVAAPPLPPPPAEPDVWTVTPPASVPPPPPAPVERVAAAAVPTVPESTWDTVPTPQTTKPARPASSGGSSKKGLVAGLVLLLAAGGGGWWWWKNQPPTLQLSQDTIEIIPGQDPPPVTLTVSRGLLADDIQLPAGLYFAEQILDDSGEGQEAPAEMIYTLKRTKAAKPAVPGAADHELTATRDGKTSAPVTLTIKIAPPPLKWAAKEITDLEEGTALADSPRFLVAENAKKLTLKTGALPAGLALKENPADSGKWFLSGTPTVAAAAVAVALSGQDSAGKGYDNEMKITVAPAPKPVTPPTPPPVEQPPVTPPVTDVPPPAEGTTPPVTTTTTPANPPAAETPPSVVEESPPTKADTKLDAGLKDFLVERIQSSDYDDERRYSLKAAVDRITEGKHLGTVNFATGKTELSGAEEERLQQIFSGKDNGHYLQKEGLTIIVVGYASRTGNPAKNHILSVKRARAVADVIGRTLGRRVDLALDYGPTDVISANTTENQAAEIYAGIVPDDEKIRQLLEQFKLELKRKLGS